MIYETDFQKTIEDAFLLYGASVAQERAIPDVRDCLKIGLRQGLYAQFSNNLTYKDKFQKAQKSVAAAMAQSYVHGDAAMYDALIRAAKPWVYRYPIEAVQGSYGDPCAPDNHSAARYVEMKAGPVADYMFSGLKKEAVGQWYNNYDDTELIPSVFPSIGFWNIVNGCTGIAVALTTSVPQFNLREVNDALIKIIKNPDVDFDEIYCAPDFAQGGTIINGNAVKDIIKKGDGGSIKIRAKLEYIPEQNMIKATEMPFGVFTNTIITQLKKLTDNDDNYGIERVIDHTKKDADIRIYLRRGANPSVMIAKLYKDTAFESNFAVNMTMLDKGCFPKVFGWREACDAYISHIRECKLNELNFDLRKAEARKNIVDGLLIAVKDIDNIISLIKSAASIEKATELLIKNYSLNDEQAKAILAMKLSSLTKMDSDKLEDEQAELIISIKSLKEIIDNPLKLDEELIKILKEVSKKFGDDRRTEILSTVEKTANVNTTEQNVCALIFDNNMCRITLADEMNGGKRGNRGVQIDTPNNSNLISTIYTTTTKSICCLTNKGKVYYINVYELECGINYDLSTIIKIPKDERIMCTLDATELDHYNNLVFVTKSGLVKKTATSEYVSARNGTLAIRLIEDDEIVMASPSSNDEDTLIVANSNGYITRFKISEVSQTARVTKGVRAISLKNNEFVSDAGIIYDSMSYNGIFTMNNHGKGKISKLEEFPITGRAKRGSACNNLENDEWITMCHAIPLTQDKINIIVDGKMVSIGVKEIIVRKKNAVGMNIVKIKNGSFKTLTYY